MGKLLLGLAASAAFVAPANATVVLFDTFDGEAGGNSSLNHTAFANFDVEGGTVDVVKSGDYAINCFGGAGSCVDLDGSTNDGGTLVTRNAYTFHVGNTVTLEMQLSGSQVGLTFPTFPGALDADGFSYGFRSAGGNIAFNNLTFSTAFFGSGGPVNLNAPTISVGGSTPFNTPFGFVRLSFTASQNGSLRAFATTSSADTVGPVIDSFSLSIAGVPEPATWGMMILGFGFAGGAMRARKRTAKLATATA